MDCREEGTGKVACLTYQLAELVLAVLDRRYHGAQDGQVQGARKPVSGGIRIPDNPMLVRQTLFKTPTKTSYGTKGVSLAQLVLVGVLNTVCLTNIGLSGIRIPLDTGFLVPCLKLW